MAKAKNKTVANDADVEGFIGAVEPARRREDAHALLEFFARVTGMKAKMWGASMVGYGRYAYTYESGREGEFLMTGFSPRKQSLSLYIMPGYEFEGMSEKLARLGKHKLGKSCLYVNKLADIDLDVLEEIVLAGMAKLRERWDTWDE
ncbi:MAG: DUF1801 domain-containing protein [Pseudomonadota bacterium]